MNKPQLPDIDAMTDTEVFLAIIAHARWEIAAGRTQPFREAVERLRNKK